MSDKRRRNRVQGAWGGNVNNKKTERRVPQQQTQQQQQQNTPQPPVASFVYQPTQEIKVAPCEKIFQKSGDYRLSTTINGTSEIQLCYDFIESKECGWMMEDLRNSIPWREGSVKVMGETHTIPRLTAWYGDIPYTYSGLTLTPYQFSPLLDMLRDQIQHKVGIRFNSMLANLYRNEKDSVDWHADDEPSLGHNPVIASLSFGVTRTFEMRQKPLDGDVRDYSLSQHVKVPIDSGCLLVMKGATQVDWQHRVPKEYHDHGERINLTFRIINEK